MGFYSCFYLIPGEPAFHPDAEALRRSVEALKQQGGFVPWSLTTLKGSRRDQQVFARTLTPEAALERALAEGLTDFRIYQRLRRHQSPLLDGLDWEYDDDRYGPETFGLEVYSGFKLLASECAGFKDRDLTCRACGGKLEDTFSVPDLGSLMPLSCPSCARPVNLLDFEAWVEDPDDGHRHPMTLGRPAARAMVSLEFGKGLPIAHRENHQWLPDRRLQEALQHAWAVPMRPLVYIS